MSSSTSRLDLSHPGRVQMPPGLQVLAEATVGALNERLGGADVFLRCFGSAFATTMRLRDDMSAFVVTGDIDAMWHRDTRGQVLPYLAAGADPEVAALLTGACRTMTAGVLADPYANAINDGPTGRHADPNDLPVPRPEVWERKYEVDSLAAVLSLAYEVWQATGSTVHLDDAFRAAAVVIVDLWTLEQDHRARSTYRFLRTAGEFADDSLPDGGRGSALAVTGMTWSGFRPSDDRCTFGYLVPANVAAVHALACLSALAQAGHVDPELGDRADALAAEISAGVLAHGLVDTDEGPVYAYEVDGLGNRLLMDDANTPSLLSLPLLGWCAPDDATYLRTRNLVLSPANPYHFTGTAGSGVGSAHTPDRHVWPIALVVQALTSTDRREQEDIYRLLLATHAGTGQMHESFHVDAPERFTRVWFAWADSAFAQLAMQLAGTAPPVPLPPMRPPVPSAVQAGQFIREEEQ